MDHVRELTHSGQSCQEVVVIELPASQSYRVDVGFDDTVALVVEQFIRGGPAELLEKLLVV